MEKSENINELIGALVEFHKEVGKIIKNAKNPFFKSSYGDLNSYLAEIKEPLVNNGLVVIQLPTTNGLTTILSHTSGQYISESMTMQPSKNDPQGQGSALTYMRRYSLASVLNLNAEDDDGNEATRSTTKKKPQNNTQPTESKKKDINYTDIASKIETLPELKEWFLSLTPAEQKKAEGVKNNRKEGIQNESNNYEQIIKDAKTESDLTKASDSIEKNRSSIQNYADIATLFNGKCNDLGFDSLTKVPF